MEKFSHPNFLDKLALKIYPQYLYPGQLCESLATINIGIIHKLPEIKPFWKVMDYLYMKKGSVFNYLGLAKNLQIVGDIDPMYSVIEILIPYVDENKSYGKQLSKGDIVCLSPFDRKFIIAAPDDVLSRKQNVWI
jgi:hypothetical protein